MKKQILWFATFLNTFVDYMHAFQLMIIHIRITYQLMCFIYTDRSDDEKCMANARLRNMPRNETNGNNETPDKNVQIWINSVVVATGIHSNNKIQFEMRNTDFCRHRHFVRLDGRRTDHSIHISILKIFRKHLMM